MIIFLLVWNVIPYQVLHDLPEGAQDKDGAATEDAEHLTPNTNRVCALLAVRPRPILPSNSTKAFVSVREYKMDLRAFHVCYLSFS